MRIIILMMISTFIVSCASLEKSENNRPDKTGVKEKFGSQFESKFVEVNGNPASSYLWRNIMPSEMVQ